MVTYDTINKVKERAKIVLGVLAILATIKFAFDFEIN